MKKTYRRNRGYSKTKHIEFLKEELEAKNRRITALEIALNHYFQDAAWSITWVRRNRWDGDNAEDKRWIFCLGNDEQYPWEVAERSLGDSAYEKY